MKKVKWAEEEVRKGTPTHPVTTPGGSERTIQPDQISTKVTWWTTILPHLYDIWWSIYMFEHKYINNVSIQGQQKINMKTEMKMIRHQPTYTLYQICTIMTITMKHSHFFSPA